MKKISIALLLAVLAGSANAQTPTLTRDQVAYGDASNLMTSSSSFKYVVGQMTLSSPVDNYITFSGGGGVGHFQFDAQGRFVWWTPSTGAKMMCLNNEGQLRIGTSVIDASTLPNDARYKLRVAGGAYFTDQLYATNTSVGPNVPFNDNFSTSVNRREIEGTTANNAYYAAQENTLYTRASGTDPSATISGYQTAAQKNTTELNNQAYTDQGLGQVWSVQTNTFYPRSCNLSKYINTYVRTQLGANNTIGTYYSLLLEAPFGQGTAAQISNYYGVYQESADAKNFFGGKVSIGTQPATTSSAADAKLAVGGKVWIGDFPAATSVNTDALLAVNGHVSCTRLKVTQTGWADFVFHPDYQLPTLQEVEAYIKAHQHLPGVATAAEVEEKGADVGDTQKVLLQKVEELTLYMIELNKKVEKLERENETLRKGNK